MGMISFKKYKRVEEVRPVEVAPKNEQKLPVEEKIVVTEPKVEKELESPVQIEEVKEPVKRGSSRSKK